MTSTSHFTDIPQNTSKAPGKTALITGASRGIGAACAELFAKKGYHLILSCIHSESLLRQKARELEQAYGISCQVFIGDIGDFHFVDRMFEEISSLDILINNAGISHVGLMTDMTPEEWLHVMNVNLNSCFYTARHAVQLMLNKHQGRIINISSIWGNTGASLEVAYSASKAGVNGFTKALAKELAPSNIQVNALSCGVIDTDMNRCFSDEEMQALIEEIPADRLGTVREAAEAVLLLAEAPDYLTGQILTMDGGFT